jgi:hypothetical protein
MLQTGENWFSHWTTHIIPPIIGHWQNKNFVFTVLNTIKTNVHFLEQIYFLPIGKNDKNESYFLGMA